ncbi:tetratricopeptide repeat protein [Patescibacteria group bacterium]
MYNIIPLVVILFSLVVILAIIIKKLPLLANFDVGSIPEEKEAETKTKIMEERLQRKAKHAWGNVFPYLKHLGKSLKNSYELYFAKLKSLETKYKTKPKTKTLVTKKEFDDFEKKKDHMLKSADDFVEVEDYEEAENKFIEIISLEPKNIEAYRGLGNLYFLQGNYEDAKQTFEHIVKINKEDDMAYARLGTIAAETGDLQDAKKSFMQSIDIKSKAIHFSELAEVCYKLEEYADAIGNLENALELEPNNPKYLDLLITVSIAAKKKNKADKVLQKLKEVNPDNKKIEEFEAEIKDLS